MSSRYLVFAFVASIVMCSTAFGSGFAIFEQGSKATAMGGAFAATADDGSAMFYNVAGLAQQRKMSVMTGGTVITFSNSFTGSANDPFTAGTSGTYRRHIFVLPNFYAVLPVGQNVTFGLGMFTPFGLRTNWQDPWPGRFVSRDANVKTVSVTPSVAFQTSNGRVAVGLAGEYRRARIALNRNNAAFNPFTGRIVDVANAYLSSDWNSAWGFDAGVLLKPTDTLRIGAQYRSHAKVDFTGTATFTQIPTGIAGFDQAIAKQLPPNQNLTTSIDFPASYTIGVATSAIGHGWDIEADYIRMNWSSFDTLDVQFKTTPQANLHRPQNWKDVASYRIGANKKATDKWDVRFGALYDNNPQPDYGVGPLLPDANRRGISFGIGYKTGPWTVEASDLALFFQDRGTKGINADNFNGMYKTSANLLTLDLGYHF